MQWDPSSSKKIPCTNFLKNLPQPVKEKVSDKIEEKNNKDNSEAAKPTRNSYNCPFSGTCYRCGQTNHPSNACPQRKMIAYVEEGNRSIDDFEEEEEAELVELNEGQRLSCVLQRVLIAPKEQSHPQRHSLFKTRCTIYGKVCNVIIDSDNTKNCL